MKNMDSIQMVKEQLKIKSVELRKVTVELRKVTEENGKVTKKVRDIISFNQNKVKKLRELCICFLNKA